MQPPVLFSGIFSCFLISTLAAKFSEEFLSSGVMLDLRSKRASAQGSADGFVDFAFLNEPQDVPAAVKDSSVRFDCIGRVSNGKASDGGGTGGRGAIKIQWRKDGGPVGRTSSGGRISVQQNGSLVITKVGSSSADVDEGYYQCAAIVDDQWTFVSRKAKLALASLSRFEDQPDDRNVPAGETVSLPCRIQSNPPPTITWYRDNEPITGSGDNKRITIIPKTGSLEIRNVQTQDQGAYKCKADNGEKHRFSKEGRLRVAKNPLVGELIEPKFEMQPKGQVIKAGDILVLECAANGQPEADIRWTRDQKPLDLSANGGRMKRIGQGTLLIEKAEIQDAGLYTCRVNNSEDSIEAAATVEVQEAPSFAKIPKNVAAKETADTEFECETKGRPGPAVTWLKNGELLVASEYFTIEGTKLKILGLVKSDQGVYQCVADNEAGSAQISAQLLVEVAEVAQTEGNGGEVPTEPLGLKAVKVGSRAVTIRWDPPLQTRGDLKGYSVFYKQNGSDRERLINVSASAARDVVISRLQPSSTFFFRVVAYNKNGAGLSSAPVKVLTTVEQGVPGRVRNFRGNSLSSTSIELRWDPPTGDEPVGFYRIIYSVDEENAKPAATAVHHSDEDDDNLDEDETDDETEIQVQTPSYTLHGLKEFTKYKFRIEAVNNNGAGPSSDSIVVRTDSDVPSGPPVNVSVIPLTADSVMVRWSPPLLKQRNGDISSYKIRYKYRDRGSRGHIVSVEGPENQHVVSNLDRGEAYLVRVAAVTVKGQGPYSAWVPVEVAVTDHNDESQPPGAPTSLRLQARSNEVLVYWTPPLDDGLVIRGYLIGWGINMPDIHQERVEASERFFAIKNLRPSREYVISLRAYNKLGNGFPIYETVRTLDAATPGPARYLETPMGLRATGISSTAIQLSWTWSDRDTPPEMKPTYTVKYNPTGPGGRSKEVNTTDLTLVIDGLKPDQQYEFAVKAVLGRTESPWSMTASTKTLSAAPSTYPRDLTIIPSSDGTNSVMINWQPPKHPNGKITHYLIYYSNDPNKPDNQWKMEQVRGDRMSASIKNLQSDSEYFFKIQAFNERGYSPISPVKSYRAGPLASAPRSGASGGTGRQPQTPNDDARRKAGSEWSAQAGKNDAGSGQGNERGNDPKQNGDTGGLSKEHILIIVGAVASLAVLIVIVTAAVLCRRRYRSRSANGYTAGKKSGGGAPVGADSKPPPDLWIHHDHSLELRNVGNASTQDFKRRSPSPPPTELPEQPTPRYHSLAAMPTSSGTLSRSYHHHQSSNSVDVPRPYPPAKAPPPQVVYTGPKMNSMNRDGSSSPYGSAGTVGVLTPTPPPQIIPSKSMMDQTPRPSVVSASGSSNPLKSFTALTSPPPPPPPLGQASNRTHLIRHVPPMVSSQSPKPKPAGIVIGTKARVMQARPSQGSDTAYSSGKDTDNELPRSYSTEELNAQMQNLDSLMKDLNAISANEFEG